jgi:hypothetical protein
MLAGMPFHGYVSEFLKRYRSVMSSALKIAIYFE